MANWKETAGTLTAGAVNVLAANSARRGLVIANLSDTAMVFRVGAAASAALGIPIPAGTAMILKEDPPSEAISLYCAGSAKAYTAYEW